MTGRRLTVEQAADLAACNPSTIKRDLRAGRYPDADRDPVGRTGRWLIPVSDLVLAGRVHPDVDYGHVLQDGAGMSGGSLEQERAAHAETRAQLQVVQARLEAEVGHNEQLRSLLQVVLATRAGAA